MAQSEVQPKCFQVGDTFSSYKEFKEFERINFVQLIHRDSRTLSAAAKRAPKVVEKANKELLYYTIVLSCVFGGKKHKSEGSGVRPRQKCVLNDLSYAHICTSLCYKYRTIKQDCPATIKLCLSEDYQKLVVSHVDLNHNHAVGKVGINLLVPL